MAQELNGKADDGDRHDEGEHGSGDKFR